MTVGSGENRQGKKLERKSLVSITKKKTTVSDAKRCRTIKLDGRTMIKGNDKQTMNHRTSKQKY